MDELRNNGEESTEQSDKDNCRPSNKPPYNAPPLTNSSSNNSPRHERSQHIARARAQQVLLNVPHIQQHSEWDCGLACSQMVLRHVLQSPPSADTFRALCEKMDFGCSVWTVDLARIMAHFDVPHLLCTLTLGVDSGYQQESYYLDHFDKDKQRVNRLFTNAGSLGIRTEKKGVTIQHIRDHLTEGNVAIVLVDSSKLHCVWCKESKDCCCWPCYVLFSCLSESLDEEEVFVASETNEEQITSGKNLPESKDVKEDANVPLGERQPGKIVDAAAQTSGDSLIDQNNTKSEQRQTSKVKSRTIQQEDAEEDKDKSGYQGHFIVVCGYSEEGILYRNPGLATDLCCCTLQSFEDARKSYGTDEDILFVYQQEGSGSTGSM
ncbi:GUCD1 [Branchiostoma lanceolatum]|uniref:GUCD1 protein n=1 Tax=Branchiostoma lanceolatum TaxID=7740 RepID=A0A8K0ABW9_BRALA|nr:GUCD1 [Branchiostoma lanceolatum]